MPDDEINEVLQFNVGHAPPASDLAFPDGFVVGEDLDSDPITESPDEVIIVEYRGDPDPDDVDQDSPPKDWPHR